MDAPLKDKISAKRVCRRMVNLLTLIEKIKIWPSRKGVLHGIKEVVSSGDYASITTHCGKTFSVRNSKSSRAARWLRNKWCKETCTTCAMPAWKLEKYSQTIFK